MTANQGPLAAILTLTEQLTDLIRRESAHLKERQPRRIAEFHGEKIRLTELYTAEMELLRRNPALVDNAPAADVAKLKRLTGRFHDVLAANNSIVSALKSVSESLVQAIAGEITRRNNPVRSYGTDAHMRRPHKMAPTSIALNQTV